FFFWSTLPDKKLCCKQIKKRKPKMSFNLMMDLIADQSFDDERLKICERFLDDKMSAGETLTARQLLQLLAEFSFDGGKLSAAKIAVPRLASDMAAPWRVLADALAQFSFDSGRSDIMELYCSKFGSAAITCDEIICVLSKFSFSSSHLHALQLLCAVGP